MTSRTVLYLCTAVALAAAAPAQRPPAVRPLGPILRVSTEPMSSAAAVRQLSDGRVLANDIIAHRVLLFDSTLSTASVVADSTNATAKAYGQWPGGLIAYRADTTMFVDPSSLSILVLSPAGKIQRVISAPRPNDIQSLVGGPNGTPGFDGQGRLIYSATPAVRLPPIGPDGKRPAPVLPDSSLIVRVDLATRKLDTLGAYRIAKPVMIVKRDGNGNISGLSLLTNPLSSVDDWAVEADGSVAIVRGLDYHVDWVSPGGTWTSSPKMPFDWEHLNDDEKAAFVDSAKAVAQARIDSAQAALDRGERLPVAPPDAAGMGGGVPVGARGAPVRLDAGAAGEGAPPLSGRGVPRRLAPAMFVEPRELPDYKPPFTAGATRADADGNLWIRTTRITNGRAIYDLVNREGRLIDRVQLPAFRAIAGFGPGVVYMGVRDSAGVVHVERARVR
jgi:hypothetical protein